MVNTVDIVYCFDEEAYGADAVAAGNDCAVRIFHPTVIEVASAKGEHVHVGDDAFPGGFAHTLWTAAL